MSNLAVLSLKNRALIALITIVAAIPMSATNQTLELTGVPEPKITWPQENSDPVHTNEFAARRIVWDLNRNTVKADSHRGVFPDMEGMRKRVAPPKDAAATTNQTAEPKPATP